MIKNIELKNILINSVFRMISAVNIRIKHRQDRILLYSNNGFRDNIYYLYQYLIDHNYNSQYEIICAVPEYKDFATENIPNVRFVSVLEGVILYMNSGHIFYCFGRIPILPADDQISIQMWHGMFFKGFDKGMVRTNSLRNQFYTYVFASSEYFIPMAEKIFSCQRNRIVICGNPKTDAMFWPLPNYGLGKYKKVIIWLPTFRQSKSLGYQDTDSNLIIPFLNRGQLLELDKYMVNHNIKLIIKLHPEQDKDTSLFLSESLKMIEIFTDDMFKEKGYDLYKLFPQTDALITDYSSVFYDYLLLNKPIGFTEDDIEEYESRRGFVVDDPDEFRPGYKIQDRSQLYDFFYEIEEGVDTYREHREKINSIVNHYTDAGNCRRALSFSNIILEKETKEN